MRIGQIKQILTLRAQGFTIERIGKTMDMSSQRVHYHIKKAESNPVSVEEILNKVEDEQKWRYPLTLSARKKDETNEQKEVKGNS